VTKRDRGTAPRPAWRGLALACAALLLAAPALAGADWPTHRGAPHRTGNLDDLPGPTMPGIRWAYRAQEHFVASPVPASNVIFVGGLGAFNTGVLHCLTIQDDAPQRVLWSKAAPYIKRPTVCAPAVADGLLVFGDGMHQTDDALLYCIEVASGRPLWQLPVPGKLVHLEGSPTIDRGRVYIGGGAAGILCVALDQVTLEGKELDLAAARALLKKAWDELAAKYEQDKKKDPDFAIPPSEDALPKPAPKILWQQGQEKWHVDAPLAVVGDRILAASAFLDDEKIGDRSLLCLNAGDGKLLWQAPLKLNPWAGPAVAGDLVVVGCSNIRFDAKRIKGAQGEVVAIALANGQVRWRKDVPGAILSSVAVKDGLAVFTATDGKLRAWEAATGKEKWAYDAGNPFFAGPAVAGGVVYAADLRAVVHAVRLADGEKQWTFDVAADPAAPAPGMAYGSPLVHGGRIYLATCNFEGQAGEACAIVCIAPKAAEAGPAQAITVDKARRLVAVPCRIAPRKLPTLKEIYPIEVIATHPHPRGQKAHETVVTVESKPSDVHKALEGLGLKPGSPGKGHGPVAAGPEIRISLQLHGDGGAPRVIPIEKTLVDRKTGRPMPPVTWRFTGSAMRQPDPNKPAKVYGADLSGTLISVFPVTDETVLQSGLSMTEEGLLDLETNSNVLPPEGTEATLLLEGVSGEEALEAVVAAPPSPAALPRFLTDPLPVTSARVVPVPMRLALPLAETHQAPLFLPSERQHPVLQRPVGDLPPLYAASPAAAPGQLPVTPLLHVLVPDARLPLLPPTPSAQPGQVILSHDPTSAPVQQAILARIPTFRESYASFVRLAIPDPFESIAAVKLRQPPPDDDPPVSSPGLPARPPLSVPPPKP